MPLILCRLMCPLHLLSLHIFLLPLILLLLRCLFSLRLCLLVGGSKSVQLCLLCLLGFWCLLGQLGLGLVPFHL